jgi:hypothetical protein
MPENDEDAAAIGRFVLRIDNISRPVADAIAIEWPESAGGSCLGSIPTTHYAGRAGG